MILPDVDAWLRENHMENEWTRNYTLIAFDAIPEELQNNINTAVDAWQKGSFDKRAFYNFLVQHNLLNILEYINDFVNAFSRV